MKQVNALLLSILLVTMSLAGCLGGEDDPSSGCTDSGAINYDSGADEDDGSCVMPAELSELEAAGLQQMLDFDQKRSDGGTYGIISVMETDSSDEDGTVNTLVTTIEMYNSEDQSMNYEYRYKMNGMSFGDYKVKQKGDIINVYSEEEWYLVNDEIGDPNNLLNIAIKKGSGGDISMDPYFTCDDEEYDIPMDWVNDGIVHCDDGTDEGVTQEEIDELLAEGRQKRLFLSAIEFAALDWSMEIGGGYQTLVASNEEATIKIQLDAEMKFVNYIVEAIDSEGLGMEFENTVSTTSIYDSDSINIAVSDDLPPAASPLLVESYYEARDYFWNCTLSYNIPADQIIGEDEINSTIESGGSETFPDWCIGIHSNSDFVYTFDTDDVNSDYLWESGFSTTRRSGGWSSYYPDFHTLRIDGYHLITASLNVSDHISTFYCDNGSTSLSFEAINDGVSDCTDGADEGDQPDVDSGTHLVCADLGWNTIAVYIEATNSCETTTNLTYVMMDDEYLNFIISETLEDWNGGNEYAGTEFWFRNSNIDGNDDLSFIGEWSWNVLSDYNGLSPYPFVIEDEMNFQNDLEEFRLDIGFDEYIDDDEDEDWRETEYIIYASFDLSQMQSGETTDSSGNNWAFTYSDTNNNGYIDDGDVIIVYTDYGDGWDTPIVKLYHEWGNGYTDESPALLPGFAMITTLLAFVAVALGRRIEQ